MTDAPVVLYVEDDPGSRRIMTMALRLELGLEHVHIFENSADFMDRVQALDPQPTLILLDIHLLPMDGFAMLYMLRALPSYANVPIVALTASVMSEEVHELQQAGFHSIIPKPVNIDTLPQLIDRIMQGEHLWRVIET